MKHTPRIVIIGGGSVAWTPHVVRDMMLTPSLQQAQYVLYDINKEAAELTKAYLDKVVEKLGIKASVIATDQKTRAFRGADYFVITISTGGLDAMAHDIAIPEDYGVYHTVGDTSGPGGWGRAMRNFEVFRQFAQDFNRLAPNAVVLNYTNPMTFLTEVLARLCKGPVVGLCHGLFENLALLKKLYSLDSEDQMALRYGGINHFFWITEARTRDTDILADLRKRLKKQSFTDLLRWAHRDEMGFKSNREVATELFHLTNVMPYLGDRHTSEFFGCYITSKAAMKKYAIIRTTVAERRKKFEQARSRVQNLIREGVADASLKRSRETAADIIDAHWTGRTFVDVGNVPNIGQITNLPMGSVVETAVRIDRNGFQPLSAGTLPPIVQTMVEPYSRLISLLVDACLDKNVNLARQALRMDPVVGHLATASVNELADRLLGAHKSFLGWLH